jgi:hypothetical protein
MSCLGYVSRGAAVLVAVAVTVAPARAYHAKTHAGLTERAALSSSLHKKLGAQLGRPLGLYEPLTLDGDPMRDRDRRELERRLHELDPEGGYVPDHGRLTALDWLIAGAAVEGVPAERLRHHFFDPLSGRGLDDRDGSALRVRVAAAASGVGTVRGIFTGASFDGTGIAAPDWLLAHDNDWGLMRFADELERSAAAPTAAARDAALARALVAAGAMAHVLEDLGDPTFVRNDYRVALEANDGPYERFTLHRYGRLGLPELATKPVAKLHLRALFHDDDGSGLGDRTQARFFSPGTLPDTQRYPQPSVTAGEASEGYVAGAVPHLVHYREAERGIVWSLDERCFADYARALLPETTSYAAGLIELLFRGRLEVAVAHGGALVTARELGLGAGTVTLYADVAGRPRQAVRARRIITASDGEALLDATLPAGAQRVAAVFRGVDRNGEPIVIVQEQAVR